MSVERRATVRMAARQDRSTTRLSLRCSSSAAAVGVVTVVTEPANCPFEEGVPAAVA